MSKVKKVFENGNTRSRGKSVKITCSEEDALAIVVPFVHVTAYMLSITYTNEMPELSSLAASVLTAKTRLAVLLSNCTGKVVEPKNLSNFSIDVIAVGGYFKIDTIESTPNETGGVHMQGYAITLQCSTGATLCGKIGAVLNMEDKHNKITRTLKESVQETQKRFNSIGL